MKQEIKELIELAVKESDPAKSPAGHLDGLSFSVEISDNPSHGDYSTNVALALSKVIKKDPKALADEIKNKIKSDLFEKIEVAGPGFINFFISEKYLKKQLQNILKQRDKFGGSKLGGGKRINIEFISANPTGPLTLGNGRGGFGGDVLSNVLEKSGFKVFREYYINDTGAQIKKLGHSVMGDSEAVYKGKYIDELRKSCIKCSGNIPEEIGESAAKTVLNKMIKPSVKNMGIEFDKWFSEKSLYENGQVDRAIEELTKKGFTYKSEGALWFKSKDLGDDKDRVLIRADGIKTYFASDIAYLKNKFERSFDKLVIFLGADHYGYVARLKAASQALGFDKENVDAIVLQLVKLFENGKEVRMSKRTGTYITMDELIDEVGLDVARFFFLQRSLNTHFNFDMNLAKEKSDKNPVFKVQYAYARICSIIKKSRKHIFKPKINFGLLENQTELDLIKQLIKFPEIIEDASRDYQLQRLPNYALELAELFHKFYEKCHVISADKNLTNARLALILAVKITLKNVLELMGISAPESMKKDETKK